MIAMFSHSEVSLIELYPAFVFTVSHYAYRTVLALVFISDIFPSCGIHIIILYLFDFNSSLFLFSCCFYCQFAVCTLSRGSPNKEEICLAV